MTGARGNVYKQTHVPIERSSISVSDCTICQKWTHLSELSGISCAGMFIGQWNDGGTILDFVGDYGESVEMVETVRYILHQIVSVVTLKFDDCHMSFIWQCNTY